MPFFNSAEIRQKFIILMRLRLRPILISIVLHGYYYVYLALSTLHTNDSPSTIARLIDMGIEHYLIPAAIIGVISQRLIKVLCDNCKIPYKADNYEKELLNIDTFRELTLYKSNGCNSCNQGFNGRTGVYEIMTMEDNIKKLIDKDVNTEVIRNLALKNGMNTLFKGATELVIKGKTTINEALKIGIKD